MGSGSGAATESAVVAGGSHRWVGRQEIYCKYRLLRELWIGKSLRSVGKSELWQGVELSG